VWTSMRSTKKWVNNTPSSRVGAANNTLSTCTTLNSEWMHGKHNNFWKQNSPMDSVPSLWESFVSIVITYRDDALWKIVCVKEKNSIPIVCRSGKFVSTLDFIFFSYVQTVFDYVWRHWIVKSEKKFMQNNDKPHIDLVYYEILY
jgi:hypothetical protein